MTLEDFSTRAVISIHIHGSGPINIQPFRSTIPNVKCETITGLNFPMAELLDEQGNPMLLPTGEPRRFPIQGMTEGGDYVLRETLGVASASGRYIEADPSAVRFVPR